MLIHPGTAIAVQQKMLEQRVDTARAGGDAKPTLAELERSRQYLL
jgi:hypothetical protein